MRLWLISGASATAATIVAAVLFLPAGLPPSRAELVASLYVQWSTMAVVWFGSYGVAALASTTVALAIELGRSPVSIAGSALESADLSLTRRQIWRKWVQRYLVGLLTTQYLTAVLALFGIGLARVPVETARFGSLPPLIADSPALAAAVAAMIVGLLGVFAFLIRVRSVSLLSVEKLELELLLQIVEMLRLRAEDAAQMEQGQRSISGAMKDLATVVSRFSRRQRLIIQEIKDTVGPEELNRWVKTAEAWPATIEGATSELRKTLTALDTSIAKLAEIAASLPRHTAGSSSELAVEFRNLLHDIGETPTDPPSTESPS